MKKKRLEQLKMIPTDDVAVRITREMNSAGINEKRALKAAIVGCMIYKMQTNLDGGFENVEELKAQHVFPNRVEDIIGIYADELFIVAQHLKDVFTLDQILSFILFNNRLYKHVGGNYPTPDSVAKLALSILEVKDDDNLLELCSGTGNFMLNSFLNCRNLNYFGVELNESRNMIAEIRASIVGMDATLNLADCLTFRPKKKASKIFANYTLLKRQISADGKTFLSNETGFSEPSFSRASDWLFNLAILNQLAQGGKAVAIVSNATLENQQDLIIRRWFLEFCKIEAVIALPEGMIQDCMVPVSMVVFSHREEADIKFIDARNIYKKGKVNNVIDDECVRKIASMYFTGEGADVKRVILDSSERFWAINVERFFDEPPEFKESVKLDDVSVNVTRGYQGRPTDFDNLVTDEKTSCCYLTLSDLSDGIIYEGKHFLTSTTSKMSRYLIPNRSIVISRSAGSTFKSSVVCSKDETKFVATGNLIVITLNENKINPYFLQAFFESKIGEDYFKSISSNGRMKMVSLSELKNSNIPCPSMEVQNEIADKYISKINEVKKLKVKLDKGLEDLKSIYAL